MVDNRIRTTSYLTACSRASQPALSRDPIARFWPPAEAWTEHQRYLSTVSQREATLLSLRNRYFLENMEEFFGSELGLLVNIGAGFSSYAYLLPNTVATLEIDLPLTVQAKQVRATELFEAGEIPSRRVFYEGVDLSEPQAFERIQKAINIHREAKIYYLLEGLVYYLDLKALQLLFSTIESTHVTASAVGMVHWPHRMSRDPMVLQYAEFLAQENPEHPPRFTFLDITDVEQQLPSYNRKEVTDYFELAEYFRCEPKLARTETIFGEDFLVLERQG